MKSFGYIALLTALPLLGALAGACTDRAGNEDLREQHSELTASMLIVITGAETDEDAGSRTTPADGPYDHGTRLENYIDIEGGDFRFYFADDLNNIVAPVKVISITPVATSPGVKQYDLHTEFPEELATRRLKIVALANWGTGNYPAAPADIDALSRITYSLAANPFVPAEDRRIPMFGVTELRTFNFNNQGLAHAGTIHLLRAMAKVQIQMEVGTIYKIESAWFTRHNTMGYCAPAGVYEQGDYVHGSWDTDYADNTHIPAGCESATPLYFAGQADGTFIGYCPEYRNTGRSADEQADIVVKFKGEDVTHLIRTQSIKDNENTRYDLKRNYWYRITIMRNNGIVVQVVPYNEVELKPDFGLLGYGDMIPIFSAEGHLLYFYDPETGYYYDDLERRHRHEFPDPSLDRDPVKGWYIIRDSLGNFLYYYDDSTGKYYDNLFNEIPNPYRQ